MARKHVWAASRWVGKHRREWYASLDGLRWVAWPQCPLDRDAEAIHHRLVYTAVVERVETIGTSMLRQRGFQITPPRRTGK